MPISVDYTYTESDDHVEVVIPLQGVPSKKIDVFTASNILKVSYPPFLLDLNLFGEIEEERSRAVLKNGTLKISLAKKEIRPWGQICFEGTKDEIKGRRLKALKERDERVQKQMEKVAAKKVEEERMVFQKHMEVEEKERQRLDQAKAIEKQRAEDAMHDTFSQLQNEKSRAKSSSKTEQLNLESGHTVADEMTNTSSDDTLENDPQDCKELGFAFGNTELELDMPPPRKVVRATFRHTPRLFKTPSRESTIKQEQEFIMKNRSNLKKNALLNEIDIGDADPVWLNSKGDEFYGRGDFRSAINAYTEALAADETMVCTLGNRAACYLHLREGAYCIEDCLAALKMGDSIASQFATVQGQTQFRKETHMRLALAFCLSEDYENAMESFTTAHHLDETDEKATESIQYLEILIEATQWKVKGDESFSGGELSKANEFYSKALSVDPLFIKAMMNRAACRLAMENSQECIDDCTSALDACEKRQQSSSPIAAARFPEPSVRRTWIVTLLCRRAAAKRLMEDFQGALADLKSAKGSIRPHDEIDGDAIEKGIASLEKEMQTLLV